MQEEGTVYFRDGKVVAEHGQAKVYKMNNELFLEIGPGHTLWALESEIADYIEQLKDLPYGNCLEIGLGLGVVSRYILTFPKVKRLTTVEINPDVIAVHSKINEQDRGVSLVYEPKRHCILNADGLQYAYLTKQRYDFIFMDFYDRIDEETLPNIADVVRACKRIIKPTGKIMGWIDKYTNGEHYNRFEDIFKEYSTWWHIN
jgi:spermidine synthase